MPPMAEPVSALAAEDQGAAAHRRFDRRQHADQHHGAVALEQRQIGIDVMADRNGVEQEIEAAGSRLHRRRIGRHQHLVGAEPRGVLALFRARW